MDIIESIEKVTFHAAFKTAFPDILVRFTSLHSAPTQRTSLKTGDELLRLNRFKIVLFFSNLTGSGLWPFKGSVDQIFNLQI